MKRNIVSAVGLFALSSLWTVQAAAHPITPAECREGGEFIRNAALARDAGITREFFVGRLMDDLVTIRAFPPELRWFAQDEGDEKFLSERVFSVFDHPIKADQHEAAFINDCIQMTALAGDDI
jgi:hypothetical protein